MIEKLENIEEQIDEMRRTIEQWRKTEQIRKAYIVDKNMTDEQIDTLRKYVQALFSVTHNRYLIKESLEGSGFRRWAFIEDEYGRPNKDEEIWVYDPEDKVPNAQVILLVNWTWGFWWFYVKTDKGEF